MGTQFTVLHKYVRATTTALPLPISRQTTTLLLHTHHSLDADKWTLSQIAATLSHARLSCVPDIYSRHICRAVQKLSKTHTRRDAITTTYGRQTIPPNYQIYWRATSLNYSRTATKKTLIHTKRRLTFMAIIEPTHVTELWELRNHSMSFLYALTTI